MSDSCSDEFSVVDALSDVQIGQLHALVQQQWWGTKRSLEDVKLMYENTSLMIGIVETESNSLVGNCRVLTDFAFRATIYDVMVTTEYKVKTSVSCQCPTEVRK